MSTLEVKAIQAPTGYDLDMPAGHIVQTVSSTLSSTVAITTNTSFTNIFSATITPKFATSKILIVVNLGAVGESTGSSRSQAFQLKRGSTAIGIADADGSRQRASFRVWTPTDSNHASTGSINYLDSPATTSATTYYCAGMVQNGGETLYINRTGGNGDNATSYGSRTISTITLMEVSA